MAPNEQSNSKIERETAAIASLNKDVAVFSKDLSIITRQIEEGRKELSMIERLIQERRSALVSISENEKPLLRSLEAKKEEMRKEIAVLEGSRVLAQRNLDSEIHVAQQQKDMLLGEIKNIMEYRVNLERDTENRTREINLLRRDILDLEKKKSEIVEAIAVMRKTQEEIPFLEIRKNELLKEIVSLESKQKYMERSHQETLSFKEEQDDREKRLEARELFIKSLEEKNKESLEKFLNNEEENGLLES